VPERPHFSLPFRVERDRAGRVIVPMTEQGSLAEIADCVELTVRTVRGERLTLPGFGRPDTLEFATDREIARAQLQDAIDEAEPRVRALVRAAERDPQDPGLLRLLAMYQLEVAQ
jgi:hypothetical protein